LAEKQTCRVTYIMSNDQVWSGERGFIDKERLVRLVPDIPGTRTSFYADAGHDASVRRHWRNAASRAAASISEKFSL